MFKFFQFDSELGRYVALDGLFPFSRSSSRCPLLFGSVISVPMTGFHNLYSTGYLLSDLKNHKSRVASQVREAHGK